MSPFRLHRRIGPRPAFLGGDATVKVVGASPFCRARAEVLPDQACAAINFFAPTNCSEEPNLNLKTPLARHEETRRVSEGLPTEQFQRHPSLTRRVTKGCETTCR